MYQLMQVQENKVLIKGNQSFKSFLKNKKGKILIKGNTIITSNEVYKIQKI